MELNIPNSSQNTSNTRERALEVAERLLQLEGYRAVSMEAVAQGVGIRKASLYHHFPGGKDELMMAVAERFVARDEAGFRSAIASSPSATGQLEALTRWIFSQGRQTESLLREAVRYMPEAHQTLVGEHFFRRLFLPVHGVLERGVAQGEFRVHDTEMSTFAFLGLLAEMSNSSHIKESENVVRRLLDLFVYGIHAGTLTSFDG